MLLRCLRKLLLLLIQAMPSGSSLLAARCGGVCADLALGVHGAAIAAAGLAGW
jgi:hypothetical protein